MESSEMGTWDGSFLVPHIPVSPGIVIALFFLKNARMCSGSASSQVAILGFCPLQTAWLLLEGFGSRRGTW